MTPVRSRLRAWLAAALLLLPWTAAAGGPPVRTVSVAVASNLKPAFEEIASAFQARNPGVVVKATYGGSVVFLAQLQNGAPFDLFLSADSETVAKVVESGLAGGGPFTYAFGTLVVWVPKDSTLELEQRGLAALLDPGVRKVAVPNPRTAPYGRAAESALRAAGVYEALKGRLVFGQNVSQTAQFAQTGSAQAGLVPLSLAMTPPLSDEGRHWKVPEQSHQPIRQDGVVLKRASEPQLARELADFVQGPGRATLERYGYTAPRH